MTLPCTLCGRPEHQHHSSGRITEPTTEVRRKGKKGETDRLGEVEQRICGTCVQRCRSMGIAHFPWEGLRVAAEEVRSSGWTGNVKRTLRG